MPNKNATTMMVQDGEGDGEMSRKGTSVIHYDPQFREEVVAFAKTTSRKEAKERCKEPLRAIARVIPCCRFDLSESTIRMWLRKADGLDYRGPSYNRAHADRVRFQGTLQVAFHQLFSLSLGHSTFSGVLG